MVHPAAAATAAKSLQSCPTLRDPIDGSPPGSPVPGILQARTLEWVAISFSTAWKWKVKVKSLSHVRLLVTSWTAAYQAPPSIGFSRQEYWSWVPLPSPMVHPNPIQSHLYLITPTKFLFLNKVTFTSTWGYNLNILLERGIQFNLQELWKLLKKKKKKIYIYMYLYMYVYVYCIQYYRFMKLMMWRDVQFLLISKII